MSAGDRRKIARLIRKYCSHAYLATADGLQPTLRSVSPIVEDDLSIWIATFAGSRKVRQIKKNPRVCLEFVSQPNGDKCAVVFGRAKIVRGRMEKKRVWKIAPYDLSEYFPAGPDAPDFTLLKVVIRKIEWRDAWTRSKVYEP